MSGGTSGITALLVSEARAIDCATLPANVSEFARQSILDWFGVTIAGAREPLVGLLVEEAQEQGACGPCTVVMQDLRTSSALAAWINGAASDAADFSDVHLAMHGHPTAAVMAAALAAAQTRNATGADLIAALVAGVETECRIGVLIQPEAYQQSGFHPTGTIVPFGAAAAAAHVMKLSEREWACALGIAATQAAGLKASAGTMSKPLHCGAAAMNGLMAARLAARGFLSRPDAIEAPGGFLDTHASVVHRDRLDAARGRFLILETLCKRHATCTLTHSTIENMLLLRREHAFQITDVRGVEIEVPAGHLRVVGITEPRTGLEAKFSLRATAAIALLGEDTGDLATFSDERIRRPEVRELRDRVQVSERDDLEFGVARATVSLADGRRLNAVSDTSLPVSDLALRREQVVRKFRILASPVVGAARAAQIERCVLELDRMESLQPLLELCRAA